MRQLFQTGAVLVNPSLSWPKPCIWPPNKQSFNSSGNPLSERIPLIKASSSGISSWRTDSWVFFFLREKLANVSHRFKEQKLQNERDWIWSSHPTAIFCIFWQFIWCCFVKWLVFTNKTPTKPTSNSHTSPTHKTLRKLATTCWVAQKDTRSSRIGRLFPIGTMKREAWEKSTFWGLPLHGGTTHVWNHGTWLGHHLGGDFFFLTSPATLVFF